MSIGRIILDYRKAYKNWLSVLYRQHHIRDSLTDKSNVMIEVILRKSGQMLNVPYPCVSCYSFSNSIATPKISNITIDNNLFCFYYENNSVKWDIGNGADPQAVFFYEEYNFLNVRDEIVIDIGASIGDSAIYFAIKGAKKVIGLEPYPYTYNLAVKNINISKFEKEIDVINAGYGEDKKLMIDTDFLPNVCSDIKESENGTEIKSYSLETIMKKYGIDSGVLKMDREGCEYNLLNERNEVLNKFSQIQIEYHYGYEKLIQKLKDCGFSTKFTEPVKFHKSGTSKTMMIGYVYAQR